MIIKKISLAIIFIILLGGVVSAEVFSTWKGMEPDKCASIWLIKRFVDKKAQIKFYPRDTFSMEGVAFDVPISDLRNRDGNATFVYILEKYKVNDPALGIFKKVIQDIEINMAGNKIMPESDGVKKIINGIIVSSKTDEEIIEKTSVVFDGLYADIVVRLNKR